MKIKCRITLTATPDEQLATVDKGTAATNLLLRGLLNAEKFPDAAAAVARELEDVRAQRRGKSATATVLVIEGFGTSEATIGTSNEVDGLCLTFDANDKRAIREAHSEMIASAKLAVAFESEPPSRLTKFAEGIYLNDSAGKAIYSLTFQMSARARSEDNQRDCSARERQPSAPTRANPW